MKMTMVKSGLKGLNNMSNFHPLEVVGRGSETQLQVGENSHYISWRFGVKRLKFMLPCHWYSHT